MKSLILTLALLTLSGCTSSDPEQSPVEEIEFFKVVGDVGGGNDGPDEKHDACSIAPVAGALAVVRLASVDIIKADPPQEVCKPEWEFNAAVYYVLELEVSAWIGGKKIPTRLTAYSKYGLGKSGDFRLIKLYEARGKYIVTGYGFEVEPTGTLVAAGNQAILFTGDVEQLRKDVADIRSSQPDECSISGRTRTWDPVFAQHVQESSYFNRKDLEEACADWREPTNDPDPVP